MIDITPKRFRIITGRLKVNEMDLTAAEALLKSAQARRELNQSQSITEKMTQQRGQRMGQ